MPHTPPQEPTPSVEECEAALRACGLSDAQIKELGDTLDVVEEILIDKYIGQLYD